MIFTGTQASMNAQADLSPAVLFFDDERLSREMLFSEFEAILDGFVPVTELAGQTATCVYLQVIPGPQVHAAVFFLISFDAEGMADHRWNVPLEQLAENSAKGPDLGGGPIRLACRSQCCIAWHQQQLWDPVMAPGKNHFNTIKKVIKRNRLAYPKAKPAPEPVLTVQATPTINPQDIPVLDQAVVSPALDQKKTAQLKKQLEDKFQAAFRNRLAQKIKEQRLHITTLKSQQEQMLNNLKLEYQRRLEQMRDELAQSIVGLRQEQQKNVQLKTVIDGQADKIQGMREYFEQKFEDAKTMGTNELEELKKNYALEMQAKVERETSQLKEELQTRDIELMYRNTQIASLDEEVVRLQEEKATLLQNSGHQMLEGLQQKGLNFVTFQPGIGHLTVPVEDISQFTDNPTAYVAEKAGVTVSLYEAWLEHYNNPGCNALISGGNQCGHLVERVERPSDFHVGESDRCAEHRQSPSQVMRAVPL